MTVLQEVNPFSAEDARALRAWLHGRPETTARAYEADAKRFLTWCDKPLASIELADVQAWQASMAAEAAASASVARRIAAVKSLLTAAYQIGFIDRDVGRLVKIRKPADDGVERIVGEADVTRMIAAETDPRDRALLRLLYMLGLRASEATGLRWQHVTRLKRGAEASVIGKGGKRRTVLVPQTLLDELAALTPNPRPELPVIPGRDGRPINRQIAWRTVKRAAKRVGLGDKVSTHWMRHSHASHALDHGAGVHVVQQSLGHSSLATTTKYAHVRKGEASSQYVGRDNDK